MVHNMHFTAETFRPIRALFHWPLGIALVLSAVIFVGQIRSRAL